MPKKPTYEELEQRVKELEKETLERGQVEEELGKNEEVYRILVETVPHGIQEIDTSGFITFANDAYCRQVGYEEKELLGKTVWDLIVFETAAEKKGLKEYLKLLVKDQPLPTPYTQKNQRKDGKVIDVQVDWNYKWDERGLVTGFISVLTDITERKRAELALQKAHDDLEMKTKGLEELNTAMKVLLKKREDDKTDIEDNVMANIKELINPYFEKMNKTELDDQQKAYLSILKSNLNEITTPFTRKMSLQHLYLTPTEIRIANLIRYGTSTKKIAKILNASPRTIETHRKNIRGKIGLQQKKANLRSYLMSLH